MDKREATAKLTPDPRTVEADAARVAYMERGIGQVFIKRIADGHGAFGLNGEAVIWLHGEPFKSELVFEGPCPSYRDLPYSLQVDDKMGRRCKPLIFDGPHDWSRDVPMVSTGSFGPAPQKLGFFDRRVAERMGEDRVAVQQAIIEFMSIWSRLDIHAMPIEQLRTRLTEARCVDIEDTVIRCVEGLR